MNGTRQGKKGIQAVLVVVVVDDFKGKMVQAPLKGPLHHHHHHHHQLHEINVNV